MPVFLTASVILAVLVLKWVLSLLPGLNVIEHVELLTYDWRARIALTKHPPISTNLALICADDFSVRELNQRLGTYAWPWPRSVYGHVFAELKAQGATVSGIDGFFLDYRNDPPQADLGGLTPDEFLGRQMAAAGNVIIPTTAEDIKARPPRLQQVLDLFATNAWRVGQDGVPGLGEANSDRLRSVTPFVRDHDTGQVYWQLAILMAARELGLELDRAEFGRNGLVIPRGEGAALRMPLDRKGQLFIDWIITPNQYGGLEFPFASFYADALSRSRGEKVLERLHGRAVLIGFTLAGDRANDWRANSVSESMPQCYAHINILNSMMSGRFIERASPWVETALIAGLAILSAAMGWRLRVGWGIAAFLMVVVAYLVVAVRLYLTQRYWLPIAAPIGGAFAMGYICLLSYRAIIERQLRHVHSVLGKVLSPNVFNLTVRQPASALDTCRRNVTILFADVRGFTRYMEDDHARTLKRLAAAELSGEAAEQVTAQRVGDALETVNQCLGEIADVVKEYDGTLDKYIGDCVMAFWGAPIPDEKHAVRAVQAAIAVHRSLHTINLERIVENEQRQKENVHRRAAGLPEQEPLAVLRVGSALNSGTVTVGFMGSMAHVSNYTVFGREVNIASRLEWLAEPDCILVTEATYREVLAKDPALAATFIKRDAVILHGIAEPVQIYEVPWQMDTTRVIRRSGQVPVMNLPRL